MIDTTTPTISINSNLPASITRGDSYSILGSYAANGPSSGSTSCSSNRDGTITDTKQLNTLGSHIITCTVTTGAKKSVSTTKTINITWHSYTIKNLVTNGSFEDDLNNWNIIVPTNPSWEIVKSAELNGSCIAKRHSTAKFATNYISQSILWKNGHRYYYSVYAKADSPSGNNGYFDVNSLEGSNINDFLTLNWKHLSLILYYQNPTGNNNIAINAGVTSAATYVDSILVIDLTEAFSAGNEPDKEWCDKHINYFEGTSTIYK